MSHTISMETNNLTAALSRRWRRSKTHLQMLVPAVGCMDALVHGSAMHICHERLQPVQGFQEAAHKASIG